MEGYARPSVNTKLSRHKKKFIIYLLLNYACSSLLKESNLSKQYNCYGLSLFFPGGSIHDSACKMKYGDLWKLLPPYIWEYLSLLPSIFPLMYSYKAAGVSGTDTVGIRRCVN